MKVLHINSNYDRTSLHQAMMTQLDRVCTNSVFVPTHDRRCGVVEVGKNVVVSECFRKWDRFLFFYKQRKIIRGIEQTYDVMDFDMLHSYTLFTDGNAAYELHKKYGIPYVVAVRNTDVNMFFRYRPHLRGRGLKILRNAAAVFFLSVSYRDQVLNRFVPRKYRGDILSKDHIIPNGIDPYWFTRGQAHKKPEGKKLNLVFAGRIDRNKNITTAARGCELLRQRGYDATLTVIGRIADEALGRELQEIPYLKLLAPMTKEQLAQTYEKMDVFVMPSIWESFGLVYAEAMSQGLPVIYSRGQGFDGQFSEGTVGYAVKSSDCVEIAQKIEDILREYESMSLRCVENSKAFSWDTFVPTYYEIYKECLE